MARRAGSNRAVTIGLAHAVTLLASAGHCRPTLDLHEGMRRPPRSTRLILFRQTHLLRREALLAINRSPGGGSMAAVQKLLVDGFMAGAAVSGRELLGDDKA